MKYISLRVLAIAALALAFAMPAKAQLSDNGYANVDWQFNAPLKITLPIKPADGV